MARAEEYTHKVYVYLDVISGGYRWVLRSLGGESLARSSRSYAQKALCLCNVESIRRSYPGAVVRDLTVKTRIPPDGENACA